jgi:hypothetical protein
MRSRLATATVVLALLTSVAAAQTAPERDTLADGFREPPASARPRVWWHWLNGNISEDGIVKDLEWMKRAGLGGVQNFDASLMTPQIVDKRLAYMTPDWKRAFRLATVTADRLGLELAIAGSPGWSETGGPWVSSADGMKKLVWSETEVAGGRRFAGRLPAPPAVTGPFQSLPFDDPLAAFEGGSHTLPPRYYADIAVLAYPVRSMVAPLPAASAGDATALADDDPATMVAVSKDGAPLVLSYLRPQTIRTATLFIPKALPPFGDPEYLPVLEAERGGAWTRIATMPLGTVPTTVSFAPVTARRFRLVLGPNTGPKRVGLGAPAPGAAMGNLFGGAAPSPTVALAQLRLDTEAKVDRFEAKAGYATVLDYYALSAGVPDFHGVDPSQVVDLTNHMRADGTLDWTPPKGRWRVVRFGTSLLGTTNHPATREATGLEVDKYDAAAVKRYLDHYLGMYRDATGGMMGAQGLRAIITDSFEAGDANWTPRMVEQFKRLRGYDPTPWMPALTGVIVGSRVRSDRFLYDYRRTLGELMASEHYGTVAQVAHANGLTVYGEALEDSRPALGNDIALRRYADIPMAAMWTYPKNGAPRPTLVGDIRGAASVAHVYGQNLVAAESLTSGFAPWAFAPADLKHVIDLEFAHGVNRPVIHTSVHQPVDDKVPGLSLAIFGQYFNRHETWGEMARPWIDYIARSSYLLQHGRNVADVAYFFGEEAPLTALYAQAPLADVPTRYAYDFIDADALLGQLSVQGGALVSRSGATYRALYLGGSSTRMTLPVLRRIAAFAQDGATIVGDPPNGSPSLADDARAHAALVERLWGGGAVTTVGKGRVIAGRAVEAALAQSGVLPDFAYAGAQPDSELLFVHRSAPDGDLYFVVNRRDRAERTEARFRVSGKAPELWHADTGQATPVSYRIQGGQTVVPLDLAAGEAVFVVFRKPAAGTSAAIAPSTVTQVARIEGPWTVTFQPGRGAPASIRLATLAPLDRHADPRVRYFSGEATYSADFTVGDITPLTLDLGNVGDIAQVRLNGETLGTAWHAPYRIELGTAVRAGRNRIEVKVANLWVNRLIGDAQPGAQKVTFTSMPAYRPDAPLRTSGLIGPVTLSAGR